MKTDGFLPYINYLHHMDTENNRINRRMGRYLQKLVLENKITRKQLLSTLMIRPDELLEYETGEKALALIHLYRLSELLGLSLIEFVQQGIQKENE